DYAASMGVDAKSIKAVHLYGGTRISTVDGDELRRLGDGLTFGLLMNERGKPRVNWPPGALHVPSHGRLLHPGPFHVDDEPPSPDAHGNLVMPDGARVAEDKMPYEAADSNSGTRVYVDGALVGAVKRKKLTNDLLVNTANDTSTFSLGAFATKLGVDPSKAKE